MKPKELKSFQMIEEKIGCSINRIYRILTKYQGVIEWEDGPLQLNFTDHSTLLLQRIVPDDGETLGAYNQPWIDPLAGELDESTQKWVEEYGKDELVDMSKIPPYNAVIGKTMDSVLPIYHQLGTLCGVQMDIGGHYLNFIYGGISCFVLWGQDNPEITEKGFTVGRS